MNIGILVDSLAIGGAERQAILCVSELRKLGHAADLVYYRPRMEFARMLEQTGVQPIYVFAPSFYQRCRRLRALFRERKYQVVHGFKMAAEVYAAVAGAWARVPRRFGSCRTVYAPEFDLCVLHHFLDKLLDGWIVNSKLGARSMAQYAHISPRKLLVLPNALCPEMFDRLPESPAAKSRLGVRPETIAITLIARLDPVKNHRMLFEAAARVLKQAAHARFLIVGNGALKAALKAQVTQLGLADKVLFLGQRADIPEILAATDISVLTSDHEGLPNAVIEAMAAGKAIASTDYRGFEELMTHESNALISPRGDAEAFSANLLRLIADERLRERLAANARQYALAHFSPAAMARTLERIYTSGGGNGTQNGS